MYQKKHLSFHALLEVFRAKAAKISDPRRESAQRRYRTEDLYTSGLAMFFLQDRSLLSFQGRWAEESGSSNLGRVFGIQDIPRDSQFRDLLDRLEWQPLEAVFPEYLSRLERGKYLEPYRFFGQYYLLTLDGSEYFSSSAVHCSHCVSQKRSDGSVRYHHQILQPALIYPGRQEVLPLCPEFVRNSDEQEVQDCELSAAHRLIPRLRAAHRILPFIVVADSLYANGPFVSLLASHRLHYLLGVKPGSQKELFRDIEGLRRGGLLERKEVVITQGKKKQSHERHVYEWTLSVPLTGEPDSRVVNFLEFSIYKGEKRTYHNSWVTDLAISEETVEELVRGARARWKIENEGFNTMKNQGYHIEHNYGHGKKQLSEVLFVLNLLAFFLHQILALSDALYQKTRATFTSREEFWNTIRGGFRIVWFESFPQILAHILCPPKPS